MSRPATLRKSSRLRLLVTLLFLGLATPVVTTGCGDDEKSSGKKAKKKKKKKRAKKGKRRRRRSKKKGNDGVVARPANYKYRDWEAPGPDALMENTRDPFRVYVEELQPPKPPIAPTTEPVQEGPLSRYELDRYTLKAIITATALPKAMVTDPSGEGHIVRVNDIIGKERPFRLIRIKRNELVFKSLQPDAEGNEVITSRSLWSQEEAGELFR